VRIVATKYAQNSHAAHHRESFERTDFLTWRDFGHPDPELGGSPITFHRCHLLWAIVARVRKQEQERLDLRQRSRVARWSIGFASTIVAIEDDDGGESCDAPSRMHVISRGRVSGS